LMERLSLWGESELPRRIVEVPVEISRPSPGIYTSDDFLAQEFLHI
jgi:hypothetical protein